MRFLVGLAKDSETSVMISSLTCAMLHTQCIMKQKPCTVCPKQTAGFLIECQTRTHTRTRRSANAITILKTGKKGAQDSISVCLLHGVICSQKERKGIELTRVPCASAIEFFFPN